MALEVASLPGLKRTDPFSAPADASVEVSASFACSSTSAASSSTTVDAEGADVVGASACVSSSGCCVGELVFASLSAALAVA